MSEDVNNKTTLIHIQATGENDTLHYIWDLTRQPTVLVARCAKDTNITIHWNKTLKDVDSVVFTPKPKYTMAFVLTKVSFSLTRSRNCLWLCYIKLMLM